MDPVAFRWRRGGFGIRTGEERTDADTFYDGLGGGWGWREWGGGGMGTATTSVENTPVGTLVVDVFDGSSKKLIWRGTSSDTLSTKPDKNKKKLRKDAEGMFKKFPPPSKG